MDRFRENHFGFRIPMITLPIGCVFQLISLVSPYWINADFVIGDVHMGLWKSCVNTAGVNKCSTMNLPGNIYIISSLNFVFNGRMSMAIYSYMLSFFLMITLILSFN